MNNHVRPVRYSESAALATSLQWTEDSTFRGYVFDAAEPTRKFVVELLIDGQPAGCALAIEPVPFLAQAHIGDGQYGFNFAPGRELLDGARQVEVRVANTGTPVGKPVELAAAPEATGSFSTTGEIRWLGGLRFRGWLADQAGPDVSIHVDGKLVMEVRPSGWTHVGEGLSSLPARSFDVNLPLQFADGEAHVLAAHAGRGEAIGGGPAPFLAFANGFADAALQASGSGLREALLDRLMPMSLPLTDYEQWCRSVTPHVQRARALTAAIIAVGPGRMDDTLASVSGSSAVCASACLTAVPDGRLDPQRARSFLSNHGREADIVVFVLAGTILRPDAIARLSDAFVERPEAAIVYADLDVVGDDGTVWPLALPAFDHERLLEQGYCCHAFAMRRDAADRVLAAGANSLYRLFNALLDDETFDPAGIVHLPGAIGISPGVDVVAFGPVLEEATRAHLAARGLRADVAAGTGQLMPRVRVLREPGQGTVSLIIPTRNRRDLLEACITSLQGSLARRACEVIVVDNGSTAPDALDYLAAIEGREARVLRIPGHFNFSRLNNIAARAAGGEYLCLLNNDVQALDDGWLDEMVGRLQPPDVGAVGAMLLWPSGVVQHGGVVLGSGFAATHAFNDRMDGDAGYGDLLTVAHQCSAVTAACLLTRRSDYLAMGGLDETCFPVNFNDVDYCLKLRERGRRIVFTPHARLLHLESASRGTDTSPQRKARAERELRNLRARWGAVVASDPFYSPVLSLDPVPFSALAWPPRPLAPRTSGPPQAVAIPPGF